MKGQTKQEKRRAWLWAIAIVAGMLAVAALAVWVPTWPLWDGGAALRPTDAAVTKAAEGLDEITVDAVFDPDSRLLHVEQVMTLTNPAGETLDTVLLRSYSGAYLLESTSPAASEEVASACYPDGFQAGGASFTALSVNGEGVARAFLDDASTCLSLPVAGGWAAGESITVRLVYDVTIPACASRFGESGGIWALGNVFPTLALYEDGAWRTDAYAKIGDPFLSACANWTVRLTAPQSFTAAASAYAAPTVLADTRVWTWQAQAVRDFALTLSEDYQESTGMAGDEASAAITVAHETAHQWWYALVGSDGVNQPWQDESLCEYAMLDYIGAVYGAADREAYMRDVIEGALTEDVNEIVTPGSPITYFGSMKNYGTVVYRRGAALWTALERLLGKDELDRFLTAYHETYRFQMASRQQLTELLTQVTGRDLTAILTDYLDVQTTQD